MNSSIEKIEYEVLISIGESPGNKYYVYAINGEEAISTALKELQEEFEGLEIRVKCTRRVRNEN